MFNTKKIDEMNKALLGHIGETHVIAKLARDFGIVSVKVPQQFFPYDLITSNHKRIEVKTSRFFMKRKRYKEITYKWPIWQFTRQPLQLREGASDFVICIGFNQQAPLNPHCFIIPSDKLISPKTGKQRQVWTIYVDPKKKGQWEEYREKWELIADGDERSGSKNKEVMEN